MVLRNTINGNIQFLIGAYWSIKALHSAIFCKTKENCDAVYTLYFGKSNLEMKFIRNMHAQM